mmetsp:Transcript_32400/g.41630  ORF Transcript_32400/g.41630 Transcript_32400/m.41630 type:complete len:85 (-) Transcript_32400:38-292(-)
MNIADNVQKVKLIKTRVAAPSELPSPFENQHDVQIVPPGRLFVSCANNTFLEVMQLQSPNKRVLFAKDFVNGLRGGKLTWEPRE